MRERLRRSLAFLALALLACAPAAEGPKVECLQHLYRIGMLLREHADEVEPRPGAEYLLQLAPFAGEYERRTLFTCPLDPDRATTRCSYRGPSRALLEAGATERGSAESKGRIIACCACGDDGTTPWHGDGVSVLYANGTTEFIPWSDMEGYEGGPVRIGPGSPDPRFRDLEK